MWASTVRAAAPVAANAGLNFSPMGIRKPVFAGAVPVIKNEVDANCVGLATDVAWIRGLSYGADGSTVGGVKVIGMVVVVPEEVFVPTTSVPHEFVARVEHA